jgi:phage terminase large subunit-like protein
VRLLRRIKALDRLAETDWPSGRNRNLPGGHLAAMKAAYGGTRLGRQDLDGELIEDVQGALWTRETMEASRVEKRDCPSFSLRAAEGEMPDAGKEGLSLFFPGSFMPHAAR